MQISSIADKYKLIEFILSLFSKPFFYLLKSVYKIFGYNTGNIVVISLHKLGDTVFTIPAIQEIQKTNTNVKIYCYAESVPIYKLVLNDIDYYTVSRKDFYFGNRFAGIKARKILRLIKPECIYDITGVMTSALLIVSCRAKKIIGTNRSIFKPLFDQFYALDFHKHMMNFYQDAVSSEYSLNHQDSNYKVPINLDGQSRVLIHPFAGWRAKEWNLLNFIELAAKLSTEYEVSFLLPMNSISNEILDDINQKGLSILISKSIKDLITIIRESAVLIGNDSGPIQIASLLGKPTFSLYSSTNPYFHKPFGEYHDYYQLDLPCIPEEDEKLCFTYGGRYGCPSFECMNQLSVERVLKYIRIFLFRVLHK